MSEASRAPIPDTDDHRWAVYHSYIGGDGPRFSLAGVVELDQTGQPVDEAGSEDWTILDAVPEYMRGRHVVVVPAPELAALGCGVRPAPNQFAVLVANEVMVAPVERPELVNALAD